MSNQAHLQQRQTLGEKHQQMISLLLDEKTVLIFCLLDKEHLYSWFSVFVFQAM
jgi:Major royal jelly protein